MFLAYLDESGDQGWLSGSSDWFVLCCLLVHESHWLPSLDQLVLLRRHLKARWGIPTRPELKSEHFRWGTGPFAGRGIGLRNRMNIYKDVLDFQADNVNGSVFAIAIDKWAIKDRSRDARFWAWTFALQRIDRFCTQSGERAMIFPDSGHAVFIRKLLRQMRRFHTISGHYGGQVSIPAQLIVEDPSDKQSHDSYFTQLVDWGAYAARRSSYIAPRRRKVPPDLWDHLSPRFLMDVNKLRGGPPGIVQWP